MGILAFDNAADIVYNDGWQNGDNGGSGWAAWDLSNANVVCSTGDSNTNGIFTPPGINTAGRAWKMLTTSSSGFVRRSFPRDAVAGDYFCVKVDSVNDLNLIVMAGSTKSLVNIINTGGGENYHLSDLTGTTDTGLPWDDGGLSAQWKWLTNASYELTLTVLSSNTTWNSGPRDFLSPSVLATKFQVTTFATVDGDATYVNNCVFADSSGGYSGCAGDPHFVDFDGNKFNFHGKSGSRYLLWDGEGMTIEALFELEQRLENIPNWQNTTFITELKITINGHTKIYKAYESTNVFESKKIIESTTGLVRGLPTELNFIGGVCLGGNSVKFNNGTVIISLFDAGIAGAKHLNIAMKLNNPIFNATGILGQTIFPKYIRKPNETFEVCV